MSEFSHIDKSGKANMVDVGAKDTTAREAIARGFISMNEETLKAVSQRRIVKGEVLQVARIAGIMGAKRTWELIPMCHAVPIDKVGVRFRAMPEAGGIAIEAVARCSAKTGVEMEALTAVSMAALTIYDMCKAMDKSMSIGAVHLAKKTGGKSGEFRHASPPGPDFSAINADDWE
ncbi:cyclic pyranopterin monophosphate synthase MoaC [Bradymonas sediminis]|uniref:Cyclic pyranopterin monophosphate synthase n=1 Tax=Bradymonas sediminis TaxID=1548548 RepID=A0A2Z4FJD3_9DELT|nr:cyclic pyranopterin monophosphate synthase MoaC [Bradymonas sediminis]AWV88945.1 cyclic pyranopterin monophosphate synthase MoaC [Bradymonas sediminis]TDP71954.1 cyclic pyranopterin monophosphate synthase subunit MoaC [Bradymonas sediminis]